MFLCRVFDELSRTCGAVHGMGGMVRDTYIMIDLSSSGPGMELLVDNHIPQIGGHPVLATCVSVAEM